MLEKKEKRQDNRTQNQQQNEAGNCRTVTTIITWRRNQAAATIPLLSVVKPTATLSVSQTTDLIHSPPPQNPKWRELRQTCVTKHSDETLPNESKIQTKYISTLLIMIFMYYAILIVWCFVEIPFNVFDFMYVIHVKYVHFIVQIHSLFFTKSVGAFSTTC